MPDYERRNTAEGRRVLVFRVTQVGLSFHKKLVGCCLPWQAETVEHADRTYLVLCTLRRDTPSGRQFWVTATRMLRSDARLTASQKYAIKRRALGSRLRDAFDPRQLDLYGGR